jgi:hypothetical protein
LSQEWDEIYWVNTEKDSFLFDIDNNCDQELQQVWDGKYWINSSKFTNTWVTITPVSILDQITQLDHYELYQNYPNPFNPITMITYQLPMTNDVDLSIYNTLGQKVATLVSGRQQTGHHQVEWDASQFASGVYYYQITTPDFVAIRKMILVR